MLARIMRVDWVKKVDIQHSLYNWQVLITIVGLFAENIVDANP